MKNLYTIAALLLLGSLSTQSHAIVTFDLNCVKDDTVIDGVATNDCTDITPSWGTVTIEDSLADTDKVVITVDLTNTPTGSTSHKVQELYLNIVESVVTPTTPTFTTTVGSVSYTSNSEGSPTFLAFFDLEFTGGTGDAAYEPLIMTVGLNGVNLGEGDFNLATSPTNGSSPLYAEVHIGNCTTAPDSTSIDCDPGYPGGDSIKVGAKDDPTEPPGSIPEPSILALFGLALVGLGFARRRNI